ncbi:hypothetical protein [Erwinia phage Snitter]|nr:hypothetical protein [Erwinia phage Snitter]
MKYQAKCYVLLNVKTLGETKDINQSIQVSTMDYSTFSKDHVNIKEVAIDVELPEGVVELGVQSLEQQLAEMRAESYRKEQEVINAIAGLRFLAAPRDGDLMDDRDLVKQDKQVIRLDDEADDAEFDEIPFR